MEVEGDERDVPGGKVSEGGDVLEHPQYKDSFSSYLLDLSFSCLPF